MTVSAGLPSRGLEMVYERMGLRANYASSKRAATAGAAARIAGIRTAHPDVSASASTADTEHLESPRRSPPIGNTS